MTFCKITAFIHSSAVENVEVHLKEIGVHGITISQVKGYGDYKNFFSRDWLVAEARIEIFIEESKAGKIIDAIMDAAHTGSAGDGIIAVIPVEEIYRIKDKSKVAPEGI